MYVSSVHAYDMVAQRGRLALENTRTAKSGEAGDASLLLPAALLAGL